ncbi:MAG: hypothetical protein CMQ21_15660 [Gammaproteobacteria bacterium]|jgi:PAS domain S-box-containing protein|nr:hypothetical protein [Gammaproteobacteria bacterium]|tara:strand:+ start:20624 stop:23227 length:2604 start_codon:yes stop_codon:yes gene_type:complete
MNPMINKPIQKLKLVASSDYLLFSLKFLLPALLLFSATLLIHYESNVSKDTQKLLNHEKLNVELMHKVMADEMVRLVTDSRLLLDGIDRHIFKTGQTDLYSEKLIEQFISFSNIRGIYDQIRILDKKGDEIIRINYDKGNAFSVPRNGLQNKASRYYFEQTIKAPRGSIYISPLDLNVENNVVELPQQPTVRLGTPLYDSENNAVGALILNFDGYHLLSQFLQTAENLSENIMLVAPTGFWLIAAESTSPWTYVTREHESFDSLHPEVWSAIKYSHKDQISNKRGIYSFSTIDDYEIGIAGTQPDDADNNQSYHWKIVSFVDKYAAESAGREFIERNQFFYLLLLIVIVVATGVFASWQVRHTRSTEQILFEKHFKDSLENIQLAAITLSETGVILFCNHYFQEKSGITGDMLLDKNWVSLFVEETAQESVQDQLNLIRKTQDSIEPFECLIVTESGNTLRFIWNATLTVHTDGKMYGITLIGRDITEERENSERLRKLSAAVEQSPNTVMITNLGGVIEYVNPKFSQLTGYSREEVVGRLPSILKSGETTPFEYRNLWKNITMGKSWSGVFHNKKKSGELYWESARISALRDESGAITHYLAVKEDINEQRRLEDEIRQTSTELTRNRELASVGRMANVIAHDIRNPLSTVKMSLQMISRHYHETSIEEQKELAQISLDQVRYMEEILSDVLSYSTPDELRCEWIRIDDLIQSTVSGLHRTVNESNVKVVQDIQKGLPGVYADATKLRRALSNVMQNAIQATDSNGDRDPQVDIVVSIIEQNLEVRVEDNGCGIEPDQLDRVFDPFVTTRAKGTGLGLAIVARIVNQHQGSVTLTNRSLYGMSVSITLPIRPSENSPIEPVNKESA